MDIAKEIACLELMQKGILAELKGPCGPEDVSYLNRSLRTVDRKIDALRSLAQKQEIDREHAEYCHQMEVEYEFNLLKTEPETQETESRSLWAWLKSLFRRPAAAVGF